MVDTNGRSVPDVEVKVVEVDSPPADDGPGFRTATYRTGADGRVRITVDARYKRLTFEARPDDRTLGWASLRSDQASPKATDEDPIKLTLLPRNHEGEGTIVDIRGKPIRGVQVRAVQFNHAANGFATDYPRGDEDPSLASAVTDETGRYRLSLPEGTTTILRAYHPSHVGESFSWKSEGQIVAPAIMEDAGGITGTVVDSATGSPVPAANIDAQRIEHTERILGGNGGNTVSNAQGHFRISGLAPGVYNLLLRTSPRGRRFTARAVEGVRVKAGEEARADLRMIEGRRLHGTVASARTGKPLTGVPIFCYSASHPRSGAACQGTYTDERARFEHFVPPGPALVYIAEPGQFGREYRRILDVPENRDPEPVVLKQGDDPNTNEPPHLDPTVECEVRIRVKTETSQRTAPGEGRSLTGRVFDKDGSILVGVQVTNRGRPIIEGATDRLGVFRLRGLPLGALPLDLRRNGDQLGWVRHIPAEAVEVDLIFP